MNKEVNFHPKKREYRNGETIQYFCQVAPGYLFGSREMTCGRNGQWVGQNATCVSPQPIKDVELGFASQEFLFDRKQESCSLLVKNAAWKVTTEKHVHGSVVVRILTKVTSTMFACCRKNLMVEVDNKACDYYEEKQLAEVGLVLDTFKCEAPKKTREISIKRVGSLLCSGSCFYFCEIYIYMRPENPCTSDLKICNGGLNYSGNAGGIEHGKFTNIYCENGYEVEGEGLIRCEHGTFFYRGKESKCVRVTCDGIPPPIENGNWSEWDASKKFSYGSRLTASCRSGYAFAGRFNFAECQADGTWSSGDIACLKIEGQETSSISSVACDSIPPPIQNGNWFEWNASKTFFYGSRLTVNCRSGYVFAGRVNYSECQAEGSWSTANVTCLKIEEQQTSKGLTLPIAVTVASVVVVVAIILVLLWMLYFRKRASENSKGEITEGTHCEQFYSEISVDVPKETTEPIPTISSFYSDPSDSHYYYYLDYDGHCLELHDSLCRGKTSASQNMMASKPDDEFLVKENVTYGQTR